MNGKQAALVFTVVMIVLVAYGELQRRAAIADDPAVAATKK